MQKRRVLVVDLEAKGESQGLRMLSSIRQAGVFGELLLAGQGFSVPDNAAGLVLLGGEGPDLPVVQACVRAQIPLLCFGGASRLLVEALGGSVGETALQDKVRDVHFSDLGVFQGVEGGFRVVQKACYLSLPEGLRILAGLEGVVLAFDDGKGRVTGMQFLPESQDMDVSSIVNHFLFKVLGLEAGYSLEGYRRRTWTSCGDRWDRERPCACSPAAWIPPWPPVWPSKPWARGPAACWWTPDCCAAGRLTTWWSSSPSAWAGPSIGWTPGRRPTRLCAGCAPPSRSAAPWRR